MQAHPPDNSTPGSCAIVRSIIVPADIVAVPRRSPLPVRKRTPWQPRPDGEFTHRAGDREWLTAQPCSARPTLRLACGTSLMTHAGIVIAVTIFVVMHTDPAPIVRAGSRLVMPILTSVVPVTEAAASVPAPRSTPAASPTAPTSTPPPPPPATDRVAAPVEEPQSIEPDNGFEHGSSGVEGGVEGGIPGGVVGATGEGTPSSGSASGPLRLGPEIEPPRKIKHVRPVYPPNALSDRSRGAVILEATIGVDGKVHETRVIHSVPLLDAAAIDAVRQWEFVPSRLNGVPVAVIITVVVQFAIY